MNQKVLKKFNLQLSPKNIKNAVEIVQEAIKRMLLALRFKKSGKFPTFLNIVICKPEKRLTG